MNEVELRWNDSEPVQKNKDIRLPEFELLNITQGNCTTHYNTGEKIDLVNSLYYRYGKEDVIAVGHPSVLRYYPWTLVKHSRVMPWEVWV